MQRFFGSDDLTRAQDDELREERQRRRFSERAGSVSNTRRSQNRHRQRISARVRTIMAGALPGTRESISSRGSRRSSSRSGGSIARWNRSSSEEGNLDSFPSEDDYDEDEVKNAREHRLDQEEEDDDDDKADWKSVVTDYSRRDPILLTEITDDEPTFTYERPNGTRVRYRVESLVDYLLFAGTFAEPETALPFSEDDLAELDRIAQDAGLERESVLEASRQPQQFADRRFSSSALVGLERCCGELIGEIPDIAESQESRESAQLYLMTDLFPSIRHYFRQMYEFDPEFAVQSLDQYRAFVRGPPNRPNRDRNRVQSMALTFFDELERTYPAPSPQDSASDASV